MNSVSFSWTATTLAALLLVAAGCDNDGGTGSATDATTTEDTTDGMTGGMTSGMTTTNGMTTPTTTTDGTGETETPTTTEGAVLSHAADMQPIWDANCTTNCHAAGGSGSGWFSITDDVAYDSIVEKNAIQIPGMFLIAPGERNASYLWHKINNTHTLEGGSGTVMPQGADPLSAADIEKIGQWIDGGALP